MEEKNRNILISKEEIEEKITEIGKKFQKIIKIKTYTYYLF